MHATSETTVLIAGDSLNLKQRMEPALRQAGYHVSAAIDANSVLQLIDGEKPGVIVLDRIIPPMGGVALCRKIRLMPELAEIPILMLSSNENVSDRVLGLDAGADDYLISPFDMDEFLARVKALQRRQTGNVAPRIMRAGPIEMDVDRWVVTVDGNEVSLTMKESRLLQELLEAKGRVLSRDVLLQRVWGHDREIDLNTRTVDVHIGRLRSKLDQSNRYIITVRNIGYRIDISLDWIKR